MPAVTTAPKTMTSPKYPGWDIRKVSREGNGEYLMSREGGIFAIGVAYSDAHGWQGQILTRQRGKWAPSLTPYQHAVIGCVAEINRREAWMAKKRKAAV
jgi:hypothetical protein